MPSRSSGNEPNPTSPSPDSPSSSSSTSSSSTVLTSNNLTPTDTTSTANTSTVNSYISNSTDGPSANLTTALTSPNDLHVFTSTDGLLTTISASEDTGALQQANSPAPNVNVHKLPLEVWERIIFHLDGSFGGVSARVSESGNWDHDTTVVPNMSSLNLTSPTPSPTSTSTPIPTSATPLPLDLAHRILPLCDRATLLNAALVSKAFNLIVIPLLWREWELQAPYEWTERTRQQVVYMASVLFPLGWSGNSRTWGVVKVVNMRLHPVFIHMLVQLLQDVSPTLQSLTVGQSSDRDWEAREIPGELDMALLHRYHELVSLRDDEISDHTTNITSYYRPLFFPSLRYVVLAVGTVRYPEFIPLLLEIAPNITYLSIAVSDLDRRHYERPELDFTTHLSGPTQLSFLGLAFYESEEPFYYRDDTYDTSTPLVKLVQSSPHLRQLDFSAMDSSASRAVLRIASKLPLLEDLYRNVWTWQGRGTGSDNGEDTEAQDESENDLEGFRSLRRLGVNRYRLSLPHVDLPALSELQTLFIRYRKWHLPASGGRGQSAYFHSYATLSAIDPTFTPWLRACPRLSSIKAWTDDDYEYHGDLLDDFHADGWAGGVTGTIYSVRRGRSELLHVRLLVQRAPLICGEIGKVLHVRGCEAHPHYGQPEWAEFWDLEGEAVPAGVVRRMKEVEGDVEGGWDRRGVEVGEEAWDVL